MRKRLFLLLLAFISLCQMYAVERTKLNFNGGWLLKVGDFQGAELANYKDAGWKQITLPRAFNEKEAFKVSIEHLSDTIMWYRKHFHIQEVGDRKYFIEFEGVRFGADIWLNGKKVGYTENGVMASGFDLTPYIIKGENVIAVRVDNSWNYRERTSGQRFQWNDKNFNANYGGIPKNVFLHITDKLYQTLPLYNNLKTTGIYIYGSNYDIAGKKVTVNAESQVRNEDSKSRSFRFFAKILDAGGSGADPRPGLPRRRSGPDRPAGDRADHRVFRHHRRTPDRPRLPGCPTVHCAAGGVLRRGRGDPRSAAVQPDHPVGAGAAGGAAARHAVHRQRPALGHQRQRVRRHHLHHRGQAGLPRRPDEP